MPSREIQWFPGHMAKTRRMIQECLPQVDIVLELLDARTPIASRNPELRKLIKDKPSLTLLNKASLADPTVSDQFVAEMKKAGQRCLLIDCISGQGIDRVAPTVKEILSEKVERYAAKGMNGRRLRAMMVGIPNVGKSTLINRLAGGKKAKAEDRPGVTVAKQWIPTTIGIDLLDMPGVLWPKFDDRRTGENLAITGAIKDSILDIEEIAMILCDRLRTLYPEAFYSRYKISAEEAKELLPYDLFALVGRKRGFLISGGEVNTQRTAEVLLDEFRGAKIGRITLDRPNQKSKEDFADA